MADIGSNGMDFDVDISLDGDIGAHEPRLDMVLLCCPVLGLTRTGGDGVLVGAWAGFRYQESSSL